MTSTRSIGTAYTCVCGRLIRQLQHVRTFNSAPITVDPVDGGNIRVIDAAMYEILTKERLAAAREAAEPLYLNHFADCPSAPGFHKR